MVVPLGLVDDLRRWLAGAWRVVIVGIGNPIRRDDNIGMEVVAKLKGEVGEHVLLIESETIPEEHLDRIVDFEPTHILIIDAALLGLTPGSTRLVESLEAPSGVVSTHFLPVQVFHKYLVELTGAKMALLLIQPWDTGFGEGLTPELDPTREMLTTELAKLLRALDEK